MDVSTIERSVLRHNVSWDLKMMSTIEGVRYKVYATAWKDYIFMATERFYCECIIVISSVPEKSVRCRDVSPIKDVRYEEVSL